MQHEDDDALEQNYTTLNIHFTYFDCQWVLLMKTVPPKRNETQWQLFALRLDLGHRFANEYKTKSQA